MILSRGSVLEIPLSELKEPSITTAVSNDGPSTLEAVEREHILQILRDTGWVVGGPAGAAARLGMNRTTLNHRLNKLGIKRPRLEQA